MLLLQSFDGLDGFKTNTFNLNHYLFDKERYVPTEDERAGNLLVPESYLSEYSRLQCIQQPAATRWGKCHGIKVVFPSCWKNEYFSVGKTKKQFRAMKTKQCMIYKDVVNKRLARKREQVSELETKMISEGELSAIDKRKMIECKAAILELENVIDIAESMFTAETCDQNEKK